MDTCYSRYVLVFLYTVKLQVLIDMSQLETCFRFYRLLMKGKFNVYLLCQTPPKIFTDGRDLRETRLFFHDDLRPLAVFLDTVT